MPKISELPIGVALTGSERFPNDQAGITVSSSISDIAAFVGTGGLNAIAINQTAVGNNPTNPTFYHNYIKINPYNASNAFSAAGFAVDLNVNGPNAASGTNYGVSAIFGNIDIHAQKAGSGSAWVGLSGIVNAFVSQVLPQGGGLFGVNGNVNINANITGFSQITGGEFDVGVGAGATIDSKFGCVVLLNAADVVQGINDAAYIIYNAPGSPTPGWKYGYVCDAQATGVKVLDTGIGVAFGTRGTQTIGIGLDLRSATCGIAEINTKHFIVDGSGRTAINTTPNGALFTVSLVGTVGLAPPPNTVVQYVGAQGVSTDICFDTYGALPVFNMRSAAGTPSAPTAILNANVFGQFNFMAYDGSFFGSGIRIRAVATGDWTTSSHPTVANIDVCAAGSTTPSTVMSIFGSGGVSIGIGNSADPGAGNLSVANFGGTGQINLRRADNTAAAPAAVLANDILAQVVAQGFDGSGYGTGALLTKVTASQNWTPTAHGSSISFDVCPNGATTLTAGALVIFPSGGIGIGATAANPGSGSLRAAGTLFATVGAFTAMDLSAVTVAALPAAASVPGWEQYVSDGAASLAWGATVTGGGTTPYKVWSNGTVWTVVGK
jgi:hypothetical protein